MVKQLKAIQVLKLEWPFTYFLVLKAKNFCPE